MLRLRFVNTTIDSVIIPPLALDQSYARIPDGSQHWQITNYPTIAVSNTATAPTTTSTAGIPTRTPLSHHQRGGNGTKGQRASGRSNSQDTKANQSDQPHLSNGAQPAWNRLQLPGSSTPSLIAATPIAASTSPTQAGDATDTPKKIVLTLGTVVLALVLLLYRRFLRFFKKAS